MSKPYRLLMQVSLRLTRQGREDSNPISPWEDAELPRGQFCTPPDPTPTHPEERYLLEPAHPSGSSICFRAEQVWLCTSARWAFFWEGGSHGFRVLLLMPHIYFFSSSYLLVNAYMTLGAEVMAPSQASALLTTRDSGFLHLKTFQIFGLKK